MPLVVPGVMTSGGNQQDSWMSKLVGKKITDATTDETVCGLVYFHRDSAHADGYAEFLEAGSTERSSNR